MASACLEIQCGYHHHHIIITIIIIIIIITIIIITIIIIIFIIIIIIITLKFNKFRNDGSETLSTSAKFEMQISKSGTTH